jgi:hypothetical protein
MSFYLMQRLLPPREKAGSPFDNAHRVFGGGMLGLSESAWDLMDQLCHIDYMGAAEFEFGALPEFMGSWQKRAEEGFDLWCFTMKPGEYAPNWVRVSRRAKRKLLPPLQERIVYCIRPKKGKYGREYVEEQFRGVALGTVRGKEPANTGRALDPLESDYRKMSGWVVLNADCMIFVDEKMWRNFAELFGGDVSSVEIPKVAEKPNYAAMKKGQLVQAAVTLGLVRNKTEAGKIKKAELVSLLSA